MLNPPKIRAKYVSVLHSDASGVAARWKRQYFMGTKGWGDKRDEGIYNRLVELGPSPDIDLVAEIIGHKHWSFFTCSSCAEYVRSAVQIGEHEPTVILCEVCLREAAACLSDPE